MGYTGGIPAPRDEELAVYGRDLFDDGNLRVAQGGDYQTVEGLPNLLRSLNRRYAVSPGEYRSRPTYGAGLRALVKKPLTNSVLSEIRDRVTQQTLSDRRIERVIEVIVTKEASADDTAFVRVVVRAVAFGRQVSLGPFVFSREAA